MTLLLLLLGCNTSLLARQARIEAAAGDVEQALADLDAVAAHEPWVGPGVLRRVDRQRLALADVWLPDGLEQAKRLLAAGQTWEAFRLGSAVLAEVRARGADPQAGFQAQALMGRAGAALVPQIEASIVDPRYETAFVELEELTVDLPPEHPAHEALARLRARAVAWHDARVAALDPTAHPAAAFAHMAAASRYSVQGTPEQLARRDAINALSKARLQRHIGLSWDFAFTGRGCGVLGFVLPLRLTAGEGVPVRVQVDVATCRERYQEEVRTEAVTVYDTKEVQVETGLTQQTAGYWVDNTGDGKGDYEVVTSVRAKPTYTTQTVQVPRTEYRTVVEQIYGWDVSGKAVIRWDGGEREVSFSSSPRRRSSDFGSADEQIRQVQADLANEVGDAILTTRKAVYEQRGAAAAAEGQRAQKEGRDADALEQYVLAALHLERPHGSSTRFLRGELGFEAHELMTILYGRWGSVEGGSRLVLPEPALGALDAYEELDPVVHDRVREGTGELAEDHLELAYGLRRSPLGAWGTRMGVAYTLAPEEPLHLRYGFEWTTPTLGGETSGWSLASDVGVSGSLGEKGPPIVLRMGFGYEKEVFGEARYRNLWLGAHLHVPVTRWVTLDARYDLNALGLDRDGPQFQGAPLTAGVSAHVLPDVFVRASLTHWVRKEDPRPASLGLQVGLRL